MSAVPAEETRWSRRLKTLRLQDLERRQRDRCCVYFIRMDRTGPIKIGLSGSLRSRLDAIQVSCPYKVEVIATIEWAAKSTEVHLHRLFNAGRLHGEWFAPETPGLLELVADVLRDEIPEHLQRIINIDRYGVPEIEEEAA